ncbi:MAG: PAS domain-containing protein, partial [Tistlia sp.]
ERTTPHDWSRSSLGPPAAWPQSLRTAVRLLLNTGHPMYIWWGEDGACLYNDAYRQSIGPERHPGSLGRPAREVWDEIWNIIGPQIEQVRAGLGATWHEDQLVPITRHGRREDVYWTYSFSPIDEAAAPNGVGGVLVVCSETTANVLARQRAAAAAERQQRLFEGAPGFIAILRGPEHHFEFVNAAYARLVGRRELVGRTPREALPEVEGQGFFELLDRVYATGERYKALGVPIRLRRSGDAAPERRLLDFIYEPIVEENGRVTGIFVEGHDVTETYLAQEALRANERRQALLVELGDRFRDLDDPADISFAAAELLGRALEVSRAGYGTIDPVAETIAIERDWNAPGIDSVAGVHNFRDYGSYIDDLKRGETVVVADAGKDPRTAANADALAAIGVGALVNLPLTEQGGFVALFYLNHASPREWSEVELDFVREVGERTRTAVERRRAEGELRDLAVSLERKVEQRTAERDRLWELSEDLLVVADYEGRLLRLSPSWTRVLGHEQQTLLTRRYDSFIHPDDREAVKAALGAMRTSGRPVHFEDRLLAADGSWRWIAWTLSPEPGGP